MKKTLALIKNSQKFCLKIIFLLLLIGIPNRLLAQNQQLTNNAEISVLTIESGTNLYDAFGHNAFRVKDKELDLVFNYGVYDFDTPNFYTKFAQGKLNYKLAVNYYEDAKQYYIKQNRTIKEQVLNLTQEEKQEVYNFLMVNYEPENQYYLYDFFYDNCATKMRDILVDALDTDITFKNPEHFKPSTFRTLIQNNLNWNSWGSVGIDLALGSVIDKKATPREHMFLPKYIHDFFAVATFNKGKSLVKQDAVVFKNSPQKQSYFFFTSPFFIFSLIAVFILYITFNDYKNTNQSKWLDVILFAFTGIVGVVILLLWLATNHHATANNYNLLWAFAFNILLIPQLLKKSPKKWFRKYFKFLVVLLVLMTLHWIFGIQRFALALLPFLVALLIRYIYLINHFKTIEE